jgi:hypothetical protein
LCVFKKNNKVKKKLGILVFASAILLSACTTDFAVMGDWKETMVVYGLLDQSQPKQYIKINKAFLGEGNALEYAQVKDSVQFSNALSVTLKRIRNGSEIATYTLTPDNTKPKDPGAFYSASQGNAIYSFASTGSSALNDDSQYKLTIRNNETGTEVTSQTALVKDFGNLVSPSAGATVASIVGTSENYRYALKLNSAPNARIYQVVLRLHYTDSTTTGNKADSVDWNFSPQETTDLDGGQELDFGFKGQDYMRFLGSTLSSYSGLVCRIPGTLSIVVISASDDLNTFINVNKPSTGIIQEKPEYTNINNGLGIFSARFYKIPFNRPLASQTKDSLSKGRYTHCLKFLGSSGTWLGATLPCN